MVDFLSLFNDSFVKIDFQTDNGCRGRFARMTVNINLCKLLISKLVINGRLQIIESQRLLSSSNTDQDFIDALFDASLHDISYFGSDFTWYKGNCVVRLDRSLCNDHCLEAFPNSSITHLLRMKSDHCPYIVLDYPFSSTPPPPTIMLLHRTGATS
ncbi:hypothetical protein GQ457_12G030850 [Hibiscus cannabinus]